MLLKSKRVTPDHELFDYGCGRGDDIRNLTQSGYQVEGFDPAYDPVLPKPADWVLLTYVLNVIECPEERVLVLKDAISLSRIGTVVAIRSDCKAREHFTSRGTYQIYFSSRQIEALISQATDHPFQMLSRGIYLIEKASEVWRQAA